MVLLLPVALLAVVLLPVALASQEGALSLIMEGVTLAAVAVTCTNLSFCIGVKHENPVSFIDVVRVTALTQLHGQS